MLNYADLMPELLEALRKVPPLKPIYVYYGCRDAMARAIMEQGERQKRRADKWISKSLRKQLARSK